MWRYLNLCEVTLNLETWFDSLHILKRNASSVWIPDTPDYWQFSFNQNDIKSIYLQLVWLFSFPETSVNVWGNFMNIAVAISHLLVVFNCSTNFIIYCSKDSKFRNIISNFLKNCFNCKRSDPSIESPASSMQMTNVSLRKFHLEPFNQSLNSEVWIYIVIGQVYW